MYSVFNTIQKIYTFTYQKTLLHTLLLLVFKMVESLQFILTPQRILSKYDKRLGIWNSPKLSLDFIIIEVLPILTYQTRM